MPAEDLLRHCRDLRTSSYEGARGDARQDVYRQAVKLLTPVVHDVLEEISRDLLAGSGTVEIHGPGPDGHGGIETVFALSWPAQRDARETRGGRPLEPVHVTAWFGTGTQHPHLAGSRAPTDPPGDYPMQVVTKADASRQRPILAAIVDAELHARIFEGGWQCIPAAGGA
ncbi:MAG: hypothetical protein M3042_00780 [Actinomycetota bacterium]|nr:hypothetical protein [Actinomycetota bacterium]